MVWRKDQKERPESQKVRWDIVPHTSGKGLDVGCGPVKPFEHFIGIDLKEFEAGGMLLKPDVFMDAANLSIFASESLDFVFSSHLLQEVPDYKKVLKEMWRVLKPWGKLILYLPHKDLRPESKLDHHRFVPDDIKEAMKELKGGWNLMVNEVRNEEDEYSFLQVFFKLKAEKHMETWKDPKPEKRACVVRYGAFGDLLQASAVFAGLKAQGYHVTVQSSPPGLDVIRHDPNIDYLQIQDKDQVPNAELGAYWEHCSKKYDKFVNLSESVEATWLARNDRIQVKWPHELRHKLLNYNYIQFHHELAGTDRKHRMKFFPNEVEKEWAKKERAKYGGRVILWALAGSAVHKTWPYLDQVIARTLLTHPDTTFVLCGGPESVILEAGWENEKRVVKTCGKWNIRQTLSFALQADMVIGPETGTLSAVADEPMAKIIFLSHSSVENLTRDWKNTVSLYSKNTPCYPCHILHQNWDLCKKDEEKGVAACQSDISADECWEHVNRLLSEDKRMAA